MVGQYLELLDATRDALAGSGLLLSADVPLWYDGAEAAFNPQLFLTEEKLASQHVIDLVDRAVLMDYRDSAFGSGSDAAAAPTASTISPPARSPMPPPPAARW